MRSRPAELWLVCPEQPSVRIQGTQEARSPRRLWQRAGSTTRSVPIPTYSITYRPTDRYMRRAALSNGNAHADRDLSIVQTSSRRCWRRSNTCCSRLPMLCPECCRSPSCSRIPTHKPHLQVQVQVPILNMPPTRRLYSCRRPICFPPPPPTRMIGSSRRRACPQCAKSNRHTCLRAVTLVMLTGLRIIKHHITPGPRNCHQRLPPTPMHPPIRPWSRQV
jgi:hypothetical protein